jgi:exopolyphosphatase/pppGpp-phosphohydrolase
MSSDRSPAELESDFAAAARVVSEGGSRAGALTTLLHIGDEDLVVLSGQGHEPETVRRLDLGAARIARDYFHHDPPTSREIERAIDFAEDELMRLGRPAEVTATLWSTAPALRAWGAVSGPTMTIETVEQWFQRLASASLGQPGALKGLPSGREAAATLLVLREFMHHRGHVSIVVVEPRQTLVDGPASA